MKLIIIGLFLVPFIGLTQTTTSRLAALEKQQTVFKADIKFLRAGKTADSIAIKNLKANDSIMNKLLSAYKLTHDQLQSVFSSFQYQTGYDVTTLRDSLNKIRPLRFDSTMFWRSGKFEDTVGVKHN